MLYRVSWEIDIEADSPLEAAQKARHYQTKPDTTATVFDVRAEDSANALRIDLTAIAEDEDGHCRTCGQPYEDGGDGYDGECPDCADKTYQAEECASGIHSWADETGKLDPDTKCEHCGEPYGHPE